MSPWPGPAAGGRGAPGIAVTASFRRSRALLEKRQQVHFGVPAGDLNQRRMGGENAEYPAGAEQHQTPRPAIMNTLSEGIADKVAVEQVTARS
jgi:hypothetical protein